MNQVCSSAFASQISYILYPSPMTSSSSYYTQKKNIFRFTEVEKKVKFKEVELTWKRGWGRWAEEPPWKAMLLSISGENRLNKPPQAATRTLPIHSNKPQIQSAGNLMFNVELICKEWKKKLFSSWDCNANPQQFNALSHICVYDALTALWVSFVRGLFSCWMKHPLNIHNSVKVLFRMVRELQTKNKRKWWTTKLWNFHEISCWSERW